MSHEIKCPSCGKVFTIDETSYAEIQHQVRNAEFNREIESRLHAAEIANRKDVELARETTSAAYEKRLADKDRKISELESVIKNSETTKQLAVTEATVRIERERDKYKNDYENAAELSRSRELMLKQN